MHSLGFPNLTFSFQSILFPSRFKPSLFYFAFHRLFCWPFHFRKSCYVLGLQIILFRCHLIISAVVLRQPLPMLMTEKWMTRFKNYETVWFN